MISVRSGPEYLYYSRRHRLFWRFNCVSKVRPVSNLPALTCRLYNNGVGNLILSVAGLIPGYWVSVATIDTIGRKPIQIGGFSILTVLFCTIGFGFHKISTGGLFALYCLCNFFQNFGPVHPSLCCLVYKRTPRRS